MLEPVLLAPPSLVLNQASQLDALFEQCTLASHDPRVALRAAKSLRFATADNKRAQNRAREAGPLHKLAVHYCLSCGLKSLSALHSSGAEL